jgi:putative nucleotidyltransferase with HDIG domain
MPGASSATLAPTHGGSVIRPRPRTGWATIVGAALLFALLVAPVATADRWFHRVAGIAASGAAATHSVRVATSGEHRGGVLVARGEVVTPAQAAALAAHRAGSPSLRSVGLATSAVLVALALFYGHHLRRSTRGRLRRVLLVNLGAIALLAVGVQVGLQLTTMSVLAVPVAVMALLPTLALDRVVGLATGALTAVVVAALGPFDVAIGAILLAQALIAGVLISERPARTTSAALVGGLAATLAGVAMYAAGALLHSGRLPVHELSTPLASPWVAVALAGALTAPITIALLPLYQRACGELTRGQLVALEDLGHPVLRQIAERSPGSWQHSLAMANMAELAAKEIGANGRLVRVGAYYHDLGKSLQPKYFIENLEPGETSPHDQLTPEASCRAIFAHVVDGVAAGRRLGLPERVVDFMHMHHGDGVLEFFWVRCQELGNPRALTADDFRYPGVRPDTRETAILAICDAVEAASRTLRKTDDASIRALVQRIVYGKLHLGQLDDSGLSMADLRRIADSLHTTIKHAHHGRIEYPWQREAARDDGEHATALASPGAADRVGDRASTRAETRVERERDEVRLDSLDAPSGTTRPRRVSGTPGTDAAAPTESMAAAEPASARAPTAAAGKVASAGLSTTDMVALSRARTFPASSSDPPGTAGRLAMPLAAPHSTPAMPALRDDEAARALREPAAPHTSGPTMGRPRTTSSSMPVRAEVTRPAVVAQAVSATVAGRPAAPEMMALEVIDEVDAVAAPVSTPGSSGEAGWGTGLADRIAAALEAEMQVGDDTVIRRPSSTEIAMSSRGTTSAADLDVTRPGIVNPDARARAKTRPPPPPGASDAGPARPRTPSGPPPRRRG